MNEKQLIIPVVVSGIDVANCVIGTDTSFYRDMKNLVSYIEGSASSILVGTTSESHRMNARQRSAVYHALTKHAGQDSPGQSIPIIAGILGSDETIDEQIGTAKEYNITRFALGLNHLGDNDERVELSCGRLGKKDNLMLYNMPGGFSPVTLNDVTRWCETYERIQGIKDSSGDATYLGQLLHGLKDLPEGFQIFCGSEAVWRKLSSEQRQQSAGLVSGTANVSPQLLHQFMIDPSSVEREYDDLVAELSTIQEPFNTEVRGGAIQSYIARMKRKLIRAGVFSSPNSRDMYSNLGEAFL